MARTNGLPFSIRNWVVEVLDRSSTQQTEVWLRIKGLTSLEYLCEAETKDGSGGDDAWKEPYITKRGAKIKLSGKPVTDAATGAQDPGQAELDYKATLVGFEGDTAMKLTDPYGNALRLDVVVTDASRDSDEGAEQRDWTLELVGEPESLPYVQLTGMKLLVGGVEKTDVGMIQNQSLVVTVAMTPANASNQKYSVASANPACVRVKKVDGLTFELVGQALCPDGVNVVVKSMNNALEKVLKVKVTA